MIALSIILFCYRPQMKLQEGYVFTGVCDSVHWGVVVSQHVLQVSRPTPREEVEAEGSGQDGFCTEADPPWQTATAAGGKHPTGMHSCY